MGRKHLHATEKIAKLQEPVSDGGRQLLDDQANIQSDQRLRQREERPMQKYICSVCGYIYDPAAGDPDGDIAPGTAFESIPDDWVCPVCGATKADFEPYNE